MSYIDDYFKEAVTIIDQIDRKQIEKMISILLDIRKEKVIPLAESQALVS